MGRAARGKSFRTSQRWPYQLTDGVIRQINEGHVLTFQIRFASYNMTLSRLSMGQKSGTPEGNPNQHRLFATAGAHVAREKWGADSQTVTVGPHGRTRTLWDGATECTVHPAPARALGRPRPGNRPPSVTVSCLQHPNLCLSPGFVVIV